MNKPTFTDIYDDDEHTVRYEELDRKKVFAAAKRLGCEVVIARPNELQLDIDRKFELYKDELVFGRIPDSIISEKVWDSFVKEVDMQDIRGWESRGGNTHIVIKLEKDYSRLERIIFQLLLGSDPVRELLNWKRVISGSENPIVLFRPKGDKS